MAIWAIGETNKEKSIGLRTDACGKTVSNGRAEVTQTNELLSIIKVRRESVRDSIADAKRGTKSVK